MDKGVSKVESQNISICGVIIIPNIPLAERVRKRKTKTKTYGSQGAPRGLTVGFRTVAAANPSWLLVLWQVQGQGVERTGNRGERLGRHMQIATRGAETLMA